MPRLQWDEKLGASGGWTTMYKGWEIGIQESYSRGPKRWYVTYRIIDPEKDYFSGSIKRFSNSYFFVDTKEQALSKAMEKINNELIPHEQLIREIDKRDEGWYCPDCGRFSKEPQMVFGEQWVNHWDENERWLVKVHYDGCHGWD